MSLPAPLRRTLESASSAHLVVTGVKSRSHVVHIASLVTTILRTYPRLSGLRLTLHPASPFLNAPAIDVPDLRSMLPADSRLHIDSAADVESAWAFTPHAAAIYVSVGAVGLKPWLQLRRAGRLRRICVVVTDEGIGTYGGVAQRAAAMQRQGVAKPVALGKAAIIAAASKALTSARWAGYLRQGGSWVMRPELVQQLRHVTTGSTPGTTRVAVILTQPFVDLGLISQADHLEYVRALMDSARAAGYEPLVRPHPAEDIARYAGLPTMSARGPVELDPDVVNAAIVLGGPSTGLVNLAGAFGSRVMWVSIPGLEHLDTDISTAQRQIFATFLGAPVTVSNVRDQLR